MPATHIKLRATSLTQGPGRVVYSFGIDGKRIFDFADISRARRGQDGSLLGYQRHQVRRHIEEIRSYVEGERPMIANAVVIAFDERVRFERYALPGFEEDNLTNIHIGCLHIPLPETDDSPPVGWIVDGQQRLTAIREADVDSFPITVTAFIANEKVQREQFVLVNNTKPLPRTLIYEMLPYIEATLPESKESRKLPAKLVSRLNSEADSPLQRAIRQYTIREGHVNQNPMLKALENSITNGALYDFLVNEPGKGIHADADEDGMFSLLSTFWGAVQDVWPKLWGLPATKSRLLHGAGLITLTAVMDAIVYRYREAGHEDWPSRHYFASELQRIKPHCYWNNGFWLFQDGTKMRWDEIQNVAKHINRLSGHVLDLYLKN